jgi:siroheme synthase-like protein
MSAYPIFLKLAGRRVVVVGAGQVGRDRATKLADAGAHVVVVAPNAPPSDYETHEREFLATDVEGAWLVIAAATPEVNHQVRAAADARRIFTIAVDDSANCSAYGAARIDRGGITIALSSDGHAPALVALLRQALEAILPHELATWREMARRLRIEQREHGVPFRERRPRLLAALVGLYAEGASP